VPTFQTFKDLSMTFKSHPVTGDLITKKDTAAIRQAVSNLLYTVRGERFFDKELGTRLNKLLFEPLSSSTAGLISEEIRTVLGRYEPRIAIDKIEVTADFGANAFDVRLDFYVIGRDDEPLNLNLLLERP